MKNFKRTLVTAALPYANGPLHIGHIAGCYLPADIYVRFLRKTGQENLFVCGSDEHGVAITIKAKQLGITPKELIDKYHKINKESFEKFNISFDIYSRTSKEIHKQTAQEFFLDLYHKGVFIEKETEQFYDPQEKMFLPDRYVYGTCPHCGYEKAYGDQCEACGSSLSPDELINPKSALTNTTPVKKKTKHWYFPLDKYQDQIAEYIESHKNDWKPNVYGQCKSWLKDGLRPRAITRDLDWGVPVPLKEAQGKVLYVWFDAPIGYISATKEWANEQGQENLWEKYWKDQDTRLVHFIGKDNIVFHAIIFPAMLMLREGYIYADQIPANEFLNLEGQKLSTSRNWAVWLNEYLKDFPNQNDELKYVLTAIMPETKDNDFSWKVFQERINNELVAVFSNFIYRTSSLIYKNFEKKVPAPTDKSVIFEWGSLFQLIENVKFHLEKFEFRKALHNFMDIARFGNVWLSENEPWKVMKSDKAKAGTILYYAAQIVAVLASLSDIFLPETAEKIKKTWNLQDLDKFPEINVKEYISANHPLEKPKMLFKKIEDKVIQKQIEKLHKMSQQTQETKQGTISYEDFLKMDLRIATIKEAEKVPKSSKLLKLKVDAGEGELRTVMAGIAKHYSPEELIGKQVLLLANLKPRKIMGIESQGMLLLSENSDGKLIFTVPESEVPAGSKLS